MRRLQNECTHCGASALQIVGFNMELKSLEVECKCCQQPTLEGMYKIEFLDTQDCVQSKCRNVMESDSEYKYWCHLKDEPCFEVCSGYRE